MMMMMMMMRRRRRRRRRKNRNRRMRRLPVVEFEEQSLAFSELGDWSKFYWRGIPDRPKANFGAKFRGGGALTIDVINV